MWHGQQIKKEEEEGVNNSHISSNPIPCQKKSIMRKGVIVSIFPQYYLLALVEDTAEYMLLHSIFTIFHLVASGEKKSLYTLERVKVKIIS